VRHALKVHEGRYQCNNNHRHSGYHVLRVHGKEASSTESGYQTIDEMTPSSPNEIFTNTWKEQQQSHKQQHFGGNASSDYGTGFGIGFGYGSPPAPTSKYNNDLTTPWHTSSSVQGAGGGGIHRIYSATPPDFPPPRFNLMEHTMAPPEPPTIQLYNQTLPHQHHQHALDTATATAIATESSTTLLTTAHHHAHHQQQLQQQAQHTLNAYQLPLPLPPQQQQPPPHQTHNHHSQKYQTYSPQFIPPALGGAAVTVTSPTTTLLTTGNNNNNYGPMQQQPKTFLPIKKGEPHTHHTHAFVYTHIYIYMLHTFQKETCIHLQNFHQYFNQHSLALCCFGCFHKRPRLKKKTTNFIWVVNNHRLID